MSASPSNTQDRKGDALSRVETFIKVFDQCSGQKMIASTGAATALWFDDLCQVVAVLQAELKRRSTVQSERTFRSEDDPLAIACRGLIHYWTRNLRNFQWEKADDHVKRINAALVMEASDVRR